MIQTLPGGKGREVWGPGEIARICHVTPVTVSRWITDGKLPAQLTPGGHRRVAAKDLTTFLKQFHFPLPDDLAPAAWSVLVVEDDPGLQRSLARALRSKLADHAVHVASDGFEAGRLITRLLPELVILDLRIPGVDGYRVCEFIRGDPGLQHTRVLAMSGDAREGVEARIKRAGADAFLAKPFDMEVFFRTIAELLGKGTPSVPDPHI